MVCFYESTFSPPLKCNVDLLCAGLYFVDAEIMKNVCVTGDANWYGDRYLCGWVLLYLSHQHISKCQFFLSQF